MGVYKSNAKNAQKVGVYTFVNSLIVGKYILETESDVKIGRKKTINYTVIIFLGENLLQKLEVFTTTTKKEAEKFHDSIKIGE